MTTANTVDPNFKNDRTDEFIVGIDREIGSGFAAGVNYIWRRYYNFTFFDTVGLEPSNYAAVSFTPAASACPLPRRPVSHGHLLPADVPAADDHERDELHEGSVQPGLQRRRDHRPQADVHHWLMNTSVAYNSTIVNNGYRRRVREGASTLQEDPTNLAPATGSNTTTQTAGSGLGNVYVNAKWLFKLTGLYQLPGEVNISAFYNARQGYPFEYDCI